MLQVMGKVSLIRTAEESWPPLAFERRMTTLSRLRMVHPLRALPTCVTVDRQQQGAWWCLCVCVCVHLFVHVQMGLHGECWEFIIMVSQDGQQWTDGPRVWSDFSNKQ